MCGIVGYFTIRGDVDPNLPRIVTAARDLMTHRGPDDSGLYVGPDGRCILGCRRLAIRDLSPAARQPMANEDASVWAVCNGEIYNAGELRDELTAKGHRFRSRCDVEVIVHLFEEHGSDLLHRLDGMFSLVVYDAVRHCLFGARDRLGIKPLYYAACPRRFAFASEPKALLALPDVSREPRLEELPSYLAFNCVPGPPTLHRDIEKLEPGTLFEVSSHGELRRRRFWAPPPQATRPITADDLPAAVEQSLRQAVAKRTLSDVPLAATLSGGTDSSLVVALLTEILGVPVTTFTIGYPGDETNPASDLVNARVVARHFGTKHHELIVDDEAFAAVLEDLPALADDPIGAPSEAAILHLARRVKESGATVLQVGEGSDEIFGGYDAVHRLSHLHRRLAGFARLMPRRFAGLLVRAFRGRLEGITIAKSPIGSSDGTLFELLRRYSRGQAVYWGHGVLFCPPEQERLCGGPRFDPYQRLGVRIAATDDFERRAYPDQLALIDLLLELPERLLMRLDRASMRHGVEARVPFLDPEVLQVAFAAPTALRASGQTALLRGLARRKLPAAILTRAKSGFPTGEHVFMSRPVLAHVRQSVLSRPFLDRTGFAPEKVRELVDICESGRLTFSHHLWSLYVLSLWFHRWT